MPAAARGVYAGGEELDPWSELLSLLGPCSARAISATSNDSRRDPRAPRGPVVLLSS